MYNNFRDFLADTKKICIIQAENPDGDSLASALALYEILKEHEISLYCPVDIPKYLRYFDGWDLISKDFDYSADKFIIVDTAANILLSKTLEDPLAKNILYSKPVFVFDHHETADDLEFPHSSIIEVLPACAELIFNVAKTLNLTVSELASKHLLAGILSDTLGLSSANVQTDTLENVVELSKNGISIFEIEEARREFMKKSPRILDYKADLIKRIEYHLDGKLATIHIPWDEIKNYSDEYNPNVLILEEMRMVENVEVAVAIKTYPDGKVTGKIRTTTPVAESIAKFYGGGGHKFASGFRTYDISYEQIIKDLIGIICDIEKAQNETI